MEQAAAPLMDAEMVLSCREDYLDELQQAAFIWVAIALWVVFSTALYYFALKDKIEGAPGLGSQFFCVSGLTQTFVVVLGTGFFAPVCTSCYCPSYHPLLFLIPTLEGIVGVGWLWSSWNLWIRAKQVSNDVFTKIPMETELTEVSERSEEDGLSL